MFKNGGMKHKCYNKMLTFVFSKQKQSMELMNMTESILTNKCGTKELFASQCKRYREVQIPDG